MLKENITENYKKVNPAKLHNVNRNIKITEKLSISDRIAKVQEPDYTGS